MARKANTTRSKSRPQMPKGNREMMKAFQELRRSSATSPIPSGNRYNRNSDRKHRARMFSDAI